jgi:8-oxo-dGTP pyrophosphatase MutT (NUDIX family)
MRRSKGGRWDPPPPDILYHATTQSKVDKYHTLGKLVHEKGKSVYFSRTEGHAWQVAHRLPGRPRVLYIDVNRARRNGVSFRRNRHGLWQAEAVPLRHILNMLPGFGEQISAGGVPFFQSEQKIEVALIQMRRASHLSWEVAKGKLEAGETPRMTAVREVKEEMGCDADLSIHSPMGKVRFGFFTPEGKPRLKTMHLFILHSPERFDFVPAGNEGINQAAWFDVESVVQKVGHYSLRPLFHRLRKTLKEDLLPQPEERVEKEEV